MTFHGFAIALSTLVGTIVGAGIFALPYVTAQSGVLITLSYFVILGGAVLLLHLMFGEVCLRTSGRHRLVGYAGRYLGLAGKLPVVFSTLFGLVGALLAYTIIGGSFLSIFSGISPFWASILFWAALSFFVIKGIQFISRAELFMNIALLGIFVLILVAALPHVDLSRFESFHASRLFVPFGVVLFALTGWSAIPEVADLFKRDAERRSLDNLLVWASIITVSLYAVFSLVVVGVTGSATSQDALSSLSPILGDGVARLGAAFGLIAVAASFLVLGNYLKNSLRYDFKLSVPLALSLTLLLPLALFLFGLREFIPVLSSVGIVLGAIEGSA
ncbi:MAG: aromatic amino acid transport family protein, partial [Candidatus Pacearchaeota archaeon]|nr:aromatic amino acid transport family protein [Candidatus Pacearchaeota archaeon]